MPYCSKCNDYISYNDSTGALTEVCKSCRRKDKRMSEGAASAWGWFVGLLTWAAILTGVILWSNAVYHNKVENYLKTSWPVHYGTILSEGKQVVTPYDSRAGFSVEFPNFYNQLRTVSVYGYPRPLGSRVPVRVSPGGGAIVSGAIYPYMREGSGKPDPLYTHMNFFPVASDIVLGGVVGCLLALIAGFVTAEYCESLPKVRKKFKQRLGTHA